MKQLLFIFSFFLLACQPGNMRHERYVKNNTSEDTIIVTNPDFDDAIDTIFPGDTALIYKFEILDTDQEFEPCAWLGDTLIIRTLEEVHCNRSVKEESHWTYTVQGDKERLQRCTFTLINEDFE